MKNSIPGIEDDEMEVVSRDMVRTSTYQWKRLGPKTDDLSAFMALKKVAAMKRYNRLVAKWTKESMKPKRMFEI